MSHVTPPYPPPPPPPPGYVPYGTVAGPVASTRGLRAATEVLFAISSVTCVVLGAVAYQRGNVLADFAAGSGDADAITAADARVGGLAAILVLAQLASVIVLCLWSYRTVKNAGVRAPGARLSPGLACGGWYIPLGNLVVPWVQLRRAARATGVGAMGPLTAWHALFVLQALVTSASRVDDFDEASGFGQGVDILHRQGLLLTLAGVMLAGATVAARTAMRRIDAATSGSLVP